MIIEKLVGADICKTVNAGSVPLDSYTFASPALTKNAGGNFMAASNGDTEKEAQFRMNQTGNIFYVSTTTELTYRTKDLFDSVTVLFAAMTAAFHETKKSLFDYEAWRNLIGGSGFFVEVQKSRNMMTIKNSGVTVNTQIIQQLLPGLSGGSAMEIAKGVLSAVNGEFKAVERDENAKLGHILFICEEFFGAPSVTVRLFFASKKSHSAIIQSPCHKSVTTTFEQLQECNTFLFVSPDAIAKYAKLFTEKPEEYTNLIGRLKELIK
ncbi:Zygote formation protein zyg1 [Klebsiella michiganensis]|uniref:Zygote formation protein zyg1 n=1 Tax=Klebsiella michiganensis TaxID=1134687 RepID=A0A6P1UXY6_9ENTR|nr:Zygote formation protein zyg1 [Klebsiella michiganensis]MXJ79871.1 Zygote formation protein zyg1 [Klebsiella michiganensis]QHS45576.1 Zygote formation protein zyg1 [Klebsiella michiganensis]